MPRTTHCVRAWLADRKYDRSLAEDELQLNVTRLMNQRFENSLLQLKIPMYRSECVAIEKFQLKIFKVKRSSMKVNQNHNYQPF